MFSKSKCSVMTQLKINWRQFKSDKIIKNKKNIKIKHLGTITCVLSSCAYLVCVVNMGNNEIKISYLPAIFLNVRRALNLWCITLNLVMLAVTWFLVSFKEVCVGPVLQVPRSGAGAAEAGAVVATLWTMTGDLRIYYLVQRQLLHQLHWLLFL